MKTFTLIISVLLLTACNESEDKMNCDKFKNGTFKMFADEISSEIIIKRNGNYQTELIVGEEEPSEFIVDWIDECTYTLMPKDLSLEKYKDFPKDPLLTVEIIEVKENSYIQRSTANFVDSEMISEIHVIKEQ